MLTKNIEVMKSEVAAHIEADAVRAGFYWEDANNAVGGVGCFIGCLTHSSSADEVAKRFGIPTPVVRLAEHIFEELSAINIPDGVQFFRDIPDAIGRDGKNLSLVHWKFTLDILENLPPQEAKVQAVIDPVIAGIRLLSQGKHWSADAAYAAAVAADAADADAAAYAAADAADADAADAADAANAAIKAAPDGHAEIDRQRDVFLTLLREA